MKKFYNYILLLIVLEVVVPLDMAFAQNYPVQSSISITPPYSLKLADYITSDKLSINLLLTQLSRPEYSVRLRVLIEGKGISIQTRKDYKPQAIILQGGVPQMLSGSDVFEYFDPNNLEFTGITKQSFLKTGMLPEGLYRICIEVLDYNIGATVSNAGCTTAWLILSDPPIINLPFANSKIKAIEPQNVFFQWTPRHTASPNSAFNVEYDFRLVEIWPLDRNPNDAILSSTPLFETSTTNTSLLYTVNEPNLIPGRKYAFRVRARDVENLDLFKNDGYSETVVFTYGDECVAPNPVKAEVLDSKRIQLSWPVSTFHTSYIVQYRQYNKAGAEWFEEETFLQNITLSNLKASTIYEYRVKGVCGSVNGNSSKVDTLRTSKASAFEFACGMPAPIPNLDSEEKKPSLIIGDIIKAGDFEVELTKVTGSQGLFSGEGLLVIPMMNQAKVSAVFSKVIINNDNRMVKGKVRIVGTSLQVLDDETKAQINNLIADIDKAYNDANSYANNADKIIANSEQVLAKAKDFSSEAADAIKQGQESIKKGKEMLIAAKDDIAKADAQSLIQNGMAEIKNGMESLTTGGSKVISSAVKGVGDLGDLIKKALAEINRKNSELVKSDKPKYESFIKNNMAASESINSQNDMIVVGVDQQISLGEPITVGGIIPLEITETQLNTLKQDLNFKKYFESRQSMLALKENILYSIKVIAFANELLKEDELKNLATEIENSLSEDLKKLGSSAVKEIMAGKKPEIEKKIYEYINSKIDNLIKEFDKGVR